MEKTVDKRIARTKEAILTAFKEMICENHPEKINVKALTERAGIHRKTFYLHYTCIEALYEDAIHVLTQEYNERVSALPVPYTYYDLTKVLFSFYTGSAYAEAMICNPQYASFFSKIQRVSLMNNRSIYNPYSAYSPEMQNIINAFVSNGSNMAFRQWVSDGKKVPMEEAVEMVSTLLEHGVQAIIARDNTEAADR